jgi:hypothetical protein
MAPVGVLFVAGLLLLAFGQRLLKPVLILAAIFAGVVLAVRFGAAIQSGLSPLVWSGIGAIGGVVFVAISYRLVLGLAVGAIGATVAMLLAMTLAEFGFVDVGPRSSNVQSAHLVTVQAGQVVDPLTAGDDAGGTDEGGGHIDRVATDLDRVATDLDRVAPGLGPHVVGWFERLNAFMATAGTWIHERWNAMPPPLRTLLLASGAAGGFLGFVAGITSPAWAAAVVTSLFGGLLVLGCGLPLASRFVAPDAMPSIAPIGWLVLWLALSFAGWAFQWWTRPQPPTRERTKAAAEPA